MPTTEYGQKRNFDNTPEPSPDRSETYKGEGPVFVIQKHNATNLHYDLRLEIKGTLKSWVLPRGPSIDPSEKRLAIPTEDHPLGYATFEGVIPEGQYGAGTVMVWDIGSYENLDKEARSIEESYENGKIKVQLNGKKISGGYSLVKMDENWLFIKMKDGDAGRDPVSTETRSVLSGKTLNGIKNNSGEDR